MAKNNTLQLTERPTFKAATHWILVTRQPCLLHTSNYTLRYTGATNSVIPSNITKFVPLLNFTKQFSPHPHPIRAQQPFNCNTTFAPSRYRHCMPTWTGNTAIITMETITEHAQNGTLIVSVSQTFPIFRLPMTAGAGFKCTLPTRPLPVSNCIAAKKDVTNEDRTFDNEKFQL